MATHEIVLKGSIPSLALGTSAVVWMCSTVGDGVTFLSTMQLTPCGGRKSSTARHTVTNGGSSGEVFQMVGTMGDICTPLEERGGGVGCR